MYGEDKTVVEAEDPMVIKLRKRMHLHYALTKNCKDNYQKKTHQNILRETEASMKEI